MTAVGVFGIGLAAYWPQFEGLKERIEGYQRRVEERVGELGGEVVSGGLVDSEQAAREAGDRFARAQVDLVLCHAVTYATSSTVLPVVQAAKAPVVLLGLQPAASLDYANTGTGEWLANCAACCVPELAGAFTRARIPYDTVAGTIDDDERAWAKIAAWVRAAGVARKLRRARVGFLGHVYPGMLDMYADFTMVHAQVGAHVEVLEIDDLGVRVAQATGDEVAAKEAEIRQMFAFADPSDDPIAGPIEPEQLDWSARVAVGLDRLVEDF
jgi:L-arabinose isomerase